MLNSLKPKKACLFLGKKKAITVTQKSGLYFESLAYWYTAFICRKGIRWEGAPFISTYLYEPVHGNCISSFLNVISRGYSELTVLGRGVRDGCGSYWQQRLFVGREQSA